MKNGCSLAKYDVNRWKISLSGAYQSEKREGWWQPRVDIPILQEHRWRCRGLICRSVRLCEMKLLLVYLHMTRPKMKCSCFTLGVWHNLLQPKYAGIMPKAESEILSSRSEFLSDLVTSSSPSRQCISWIFDLGLAGQQNHQWGFLPLGTYLAVPKAANVQPQGLTVSCPADEVSFALILHRSHQPGCEDLQLGTFEKFQRWFLLFLIYGSKRVHMRKTLNWFVSCLRKSIRLRR